MFVIAHLPKPFPFVVAAGSWVPIALESVAGAVTDVFPVIFYVPSYPFLPFRELRATRTRGVIEGTCSVVVCL